jgi:predicted ester cyclase
MPVEENKALIYKIYDEYNKGNYDVYDECFNDDFLSYRWDGNVLDKKAYKKMLLGFKDMFPGIQRTIQDIIVTEDRAALYFTWTGKDNFTFQGRKPTGKLLNVKEIYFIRFKNGKISEYRQYGDAYGMGYQMGELIMAKDVKK